MPTKISQLGICDRCGQEIPRSQWYTSKGKPRLYCNRDCRNAANSHAGEPVRHAKLMKRIAAGKWINPHEIHPPTSEEQAARARKGRLKEVEADTWRNPALTEEARSKLSRPRKHSGALADAIEKLKRGLSVSELTAEEADAHRSYRRSLFKARKKP